MYEKKIYMKSSFKAKTLSLNETPSHNTFIFYKFRFFKQPLNTILSFFSPRNVDV